MKKILLGLCLLAGIATNASAQFGLPAHMVLLTSTVATCLCLAFGPCHCLSTVVQSWALGLFGRAILLHTGFG